MADPALLSNLTGQDLWIIQSNGTLFVEPCAAVECFRCDFSMLWAAETKFHCSLLYLRGG